MRLFDTHAHYFDERFAAEYPGGAAGALEDSLAAGVELILNCATNPDNALSTVRLTEAFPFVYGAVGIHPSDCFFLPNNALSDSLDRIADLLCLPKIMALGEIGLDYHYPEGTDRERQMAYFDAQLSLSEDKHLPVIIHDRDAHGDVFDLVRAHPRAFGVLHSFSGGPELAKQYAKRGWYLSFGGPLTYKNAHHVREAALAVPREQLLLETDSPYLPPVPHRGELNYSGYMAFTCQCLAGLWQVSPDEAAETTLENGKRLFSIE